MGWRAGWLVWSLLLLEVVVGSGRLCYSCNQRRPAISCPLNATVISVKWVCHEIEFNPNWLCCRYKQLNMYINLNMGLNIKKMPSGTVNSISYFILQYLFKCDVLQIFALIVSFASLAWCFVYAKLYTILWIAKILNFSVSQFCHRVHAVNNYIDIKCLGILKLRNHW